MYYWYVFCIVISLIFHVGKTIGSRFPISHIYMYSYGKVDFDLHVFGLRREFRNTIPQVNENQLHVLFSNIQILLLYKLNVLTKHMNCLKPKKILKIIQYNKYIIASNSIHKTKQSTMYNKIPYSFKIYVDTPAYSIKSLIIYNLFRKLQHTVNIKILNNQYIFVWHNTREVYFKIQLK